MNRPLRVAAVALASILLLSACASDPLANDYKETDQNYVSGDGSVTEYPIAERGEPVDFEAETDAGDTVSSDDHRLRALVVQVSVAAFVPYAAA